MYRKKIHQIRFIRDMLVVTDTSRNRVMLFPRILDGNSTSIDIGCVRDKDGFPRHFNSIFNMKGRIYLLAHNRTTKTGEKSGIYLLDYEFNLIKVEKTEFSNAHNIYKSKNFFVVCDSANGDVYNFDKCVLKSNYFTRGLSFSKDYVIIGGSAVASYNERKKPGKGKLFVLDRGLEQLLCEIEIPVSQIMEIRRTDVQEFS